MTMAPSPRLAVLPCRAPPKLARSCIPLDSVRPCHGSHVVTSRHRKVHVRRQQHVAAKFQRRTPSDAASRHQISHSPLSRMGCIHLADILRSFVSFTFGSSQVCWRADERYPCCPRYPLLESASAPLDSCYRAPLICFPTNAQLRSAPCLTPNLLLHIHSAPVD